MMNDPASAALKSHKGGGYLQGPGVPLLTEVALYFFFAD